MEPCTLNLRKYKLLSNILMASLDFVKLLKKTFKGLSVMKYHFHGLFPAPPPTTGTICNEVTSACIRLNRLWWLCGLEHVSNLYLTIGTSSKKIQEPALELHSRAAPSVEAHHRVNGLTQEEIPEEGG